MWRLGAGARETWSAVISQLKGRDCAGISIFMHEMLGARCCRTRRRQPCCRFPPIMSMSACTRRMIGDVLRRNSTSI